MKNIPFHPLADIFPLIHGKEFVELKRDIRENGVHEPIVLLDGQILDGRNRFRACQEVSVEPDFVEYDGDDPAGFVVSLNLHRRHLNESQRAMVAAKLANMPDHRPTDKGANLHTSAAEAGEKLNVSERSVKTAKKVQTTGTPELREKVEQGSVSVSAAADVASLPPEEQAQVVARGEKEILQRAKEIRGAKAEERKREKLAKIEELKAREVKPADGVYDVIVLDPPWPMEKIEREVRPNQVAFDYPTMTEQELAGLELPMADDCHVWVWTTHKFLPMAFRLLDDWRLRYVCAFVWHKPGGFQPIGLPQYNAEFALYARKGSPIFTDTKAFNTAFSAPRGAHSEKPEEFYDVLRRVTSGRRLDMFNRREIDGFDGWGNESGDQLAG